MKNRFTITFILLFLFSITISAQLVNNGATIIVKNGATLHVDSDVTNTTGTLQLEANATLEVSGDFTSETAASFDANSSSTTKFFGSASKNIKSGGDDFGNVIMNKDDGINMSLTDNMEINGNLQFTAANGNKLILGANNLTLGTGTSVSNQGTNRYIQADGTGTIKKNYNATGTFSFPIGDNDEYSPIDINVTAGTFGSAANIAVNVTDAVHPSKYSDADEYITRYWTVTATDITGYAATLTGTYTDADISGTTESNIKGASYISDWSFANAGGDDANNTVTGDVSATVDFSGMNFYGKMASLKAFLQGPYSSGNMTTTLNSSGLIPTSTPYSTTYSADETVSSIPSNITDWIKIELRDASDPSSVLKSYSKFIKNDGQVYELDGSSAPKFKNAPTSAYIAVRHRNHLGIRTTSALTLTSNPSHDFTTASSQAYGTDPMKEVASGVWAMWGGNANGNSNVRYSGPGNDNNTLLNTVLGGNKSGIISNTYQAADLNMNGNVKYSGPGNDNNTLLNTVLGGNKSLIINEQL